MEGSLQHGGATGIDPVEVSLADLVRGSDGALSYQSLQRFQVGLEHACDCADSPLFNLCAHIFNPWLHEEFKAKRSVGKFSWLVRPRLVVLNCSLVRKGLGLNDVRGLASRALSARTGEVLFSNPKRNTSY